MPAIPEVDGSWVGPVLSLLDGRVARLGEWRAQGSMLLDGRFARLSYRGPNGEGELTVGHHREDDLWTIGWMDASLLDTEWLVLRGSGEQAQAEGTWWTGSSGPRWEWTIRVSAEADDLGIDMSSRSPEGREELALRIRLRRVGLNTV